LSQPLPERSDQVRDRHLSGRRQKSDLRNTGGLLGIAPGASRGNGEQEYDADERSKAHGVHWSLVLAESVVNDNPAVKRASFSRSGRPARPPSQTQAHRTAPSQGCAVLSNAANNPPAQG